MPDMTALLFYRNGKHSAGGGKILRSNGNRNFAEILRNFAEFCGNFAVNVWNENPQAGYRPWQGKCKNMEKLSQKEG